MQINSRRAFLQGMAGTTLALPWMESLQGALRPAGAAAPQRFAVFYVPIGVVRRGFFPGEAEAAIPKFTSSQEEIKTGYAPTAGMTDWTEFTPTQEPLRELRELVTFVSGTDRFYQHGSDVHAQCASCFLSSATAHEIRTSVYPLARTLDHVIADRIGQTTPFPTLELSCNSHKDNKESIYFDNISWYDTGYVAPSLRHPRRVYQRLFGMEERTAFRDITDLVLDDAHSLHRRLSRSDREKFGEYLDGIRSVEKQMERLEQLRIDLTDVGLPEPPEARLPRGEYIRVMGDLMIAALQTGLTNVATLMVGPERWDTPFLYESLFDKPMSHHQMSHNQSKFINELLMVDRFHMEQYAYLIRRMSQIREAEDRSLLDNTLLIYGSGLGDGATHQYTDLPIIVAGSGGGRFKTGKHLHCQEGTPLANLWLTYANAFGCGLDRFADSTSEIHELKAA